MEMICVFLQNELKQANNRRQHQLPEKEEVYRRKETSYLFVDVCS